MASSSSSSGSNHNQTLSFYDFLDRMRNPASIDLVRSIKSFIVSFSFTTESPENDGKKLQDFLLDMEVAIREHPLWLGASEEEIDCAVEGLEKYVMTKLFNRTFASSPEDSKIDQDISEKIYMLQYFLRPEHLDIPQVFRNEASWLLAEKELQKMNAFKAPREKLLCILSCCRVINNLLLNATMSEDRVPGADDFLPVLIYVVIKANPPQLHSNLNYIQLYRRQSKLVSESAYYFTNFVSAKSFIFDLDAKSLSIDESDFQENMKNARSAIIGASTKTSYASDETAVVPLLVTRTGHKGQENDHLSTFDDITSLVGYRDFAHSRGKRAMEVDRDGRSSYPFMKAIAGELTVEDVHVLLNIYKDVVNKYTTLQRAVERFAIFKSEPAALSDSQENNIEIEQSGEKNEKHHIVPD